MSDLRRAVEAAREERAVAPAEEVERDVPKGRVTEREDGPEGEALDEERPAQRSERRGAVRGQVVGKGEVENDGEDAPDRVGLREWASGMMHTGIARGGLDERGLRPSPCST